MINSLHDENIYANKKGQILTGRKRQKKILKLKYLFESIRCLKSFNWPICSNRMNNSTKGCF